MEGFLHMIEFSRHYWQESFDGDSFGSQSRFDAYAITMTPLGPELTVYKKDLIHIN